jgi:hypothetical protein
MTNLYRIFQSSFRASYILEKTRIMTDCESKFFQVSRDIDTSKSKSDWDKTQKLVDERYKMINDCMRKLSSVDKIYVSTLTKNKE